METRNILHVFVASPSDLEEERKLCTMLERQTNSEWEESGWAIRIDAWEDCPRGVGRPQDHINPKVSTCDIFIGMIWRKWGTPTGKYSSGFEEEYELALNRYAESGSPKIFLFFKGLDINNMEAFTPDVNRILEFKKRVKDTIFINEFENINDFERMLKSTITRLLVEKTKGYKTAQETEISTVESKKIEPGPASIPQSIETKSGPFAKQLSDVLEHLTEDIHAGNIDHIRPENMISTKFDISRLNLLANSLSSTFISNGILGNHEINFLYANKELILMSRIERHLVMRTLINDEYNHCPGWYWFRSTAPDVIQETLFWFAGGDRDAGVREAAIKLLLRAAIGPVPELPTTTASSLLILRDRSPMVRVAAIEYWGKMGNKDDLINIEQYVDDDEEDIRKAAIRAKFDILMRSSTVAAFRHIKNYPRILHSFSTEIIAMLPKAESEALIEHLDVDDNYYKAQLIRELVNRKYYAVDDLRTFLKHKSLKVRVAAALQLLKHGTKFTPEELDLIIKGDESDSKSKMLEWLLSSWQHDDQDILELINMNFDRREIEAQVDWFSTYGYLAYKALGFYYSDTYLSRVRADISDDFSKIKDLSIEKIRGECGEIAVPAFSKLLEKEDIRDYKTEEFLGAALASIARNGSNDDADIARQFLDHHDQRVQLKAIEIIVKFGDKRDLASLKKLMTNGTLSVKEAAAKAALILSPGINGIAHEFLGSGDSGLIIAALKSL